MNEYWDNRYKKGGHSGHSNKEWERTILHYYVDHSEPFLDVGCGDLKLWLSLPARYAGIDISPTIIERNYMNYPNIPFKVLDATKPTDSIMKCDNVICFSVVYHIMTREEILQLLDNLVSWTGKYLFITNFRTAPFEYDRSYQRYWEVEKHIHMDLIAQHYHQSMVMHVFRREE